MEAEIRTIRLQTVTIKDIVAHRTEGDWLVIESKEGRNVTYISALNVLYVNITTSPS